MWYTYDGGHFWGMHWIWWILWVIFLFWIFALPYDVPGQKKPKNTPLEILKKRFAAGEINFDEFEKRKSLLEKNP